jgi:hypothetical protein
MAYKVVTKSFPVASFAFGGGYAACPSGSRVVAGGAYFDIGGGGPNPQVLTYISGSSPTLQANGWYGAGQNEDMVTHNLIVVAECLPKHLGRLFGADNLVPYKVKTTTFQVASSQGGGGYAQCPTGSRIVAGGAFFNIGGQGPNPSTTDYITGLSPKLQTDGFYGAAFNFTGQTLPLVVVAECLPRGTLTLIGANNLKPYQVVTNTGSLAGGSLGGGYVACPTGGRIVSGGEYFDFGGGGPLPADVAPFLTGSSAKLQSNGWYAAMENGDQERPRTFVQVAECLPR